MVRWSPFGCEVQYRHSKVIGGDAKAQWTVPLLADPGLCMFCAAQLSHFLRLL
jgi:hypothetical protein